MRPDNEFSDNIRKVDRGEPFRCSAASGGIPRILLGLALAGVAACAGPAPESDRGAIYTAKAPAADERVCAWFGDASGSTLFFGQSAFWSALRNSGGRPTADLDLPGPALIGRFDLAREQLLPPLDVTNADDRSGVWDVLAHPNGRIYFTTYFSVAGSVDPATGTVERFDAAGTGLNELALGADGTLLASRYGVPGGGGGGVAVLDTTGVIVDEFALTPPSGFSLAAKTVAWDRSRAEIWVTTDLLPLADGPEQRARHDAYVLDRRGVLQRRIETPEIQFVNFAPDGTGYLAEVAENELWLRIVPPADGDADELRLLLDDHFASGHDFVQDIQITSEGGAIVTRWSGWVHLASAAGAKHSLQLPALEPNGLYYTAALHGDRVCATHCLDVSVVCRGVSAGG